MGRGPSVAVPTRYLEIIKGLPENTALPGDAKVYVERLKEKDKGADVPLSFMEREVLNAFVAKFEKKEENSVEVGADGSVKIKQAKQQSGAVAASPEALGAAANFNMQQAAFGRLVELEGKFIDQLSKTQGSNHFETLIGVQKATYDAIIASQKTHYEALLTKEQERANILQDRINTLETHDKEYWDKLKESEDKRLQLHADLYDREKDAKDLLGLLENAEQMMEFKESLKDPTLALIESQPVREAIDLAKRIVSVVEEQQKNKPH